MKQIVFRIARDPSPDDPNPHRWELDRVSFTTEEEATDFAESEGKELATEYGDEYVQDSYRWLIVTDVIEVEAS